MKEGAMSEEFWNIIESVKQTSGTDWEARPENLHAYLITLKAEEIANFDKEYSNKLNQAYRWDLWGAAYLINGGCSDDGFDYWCDFLISEGKTTFEAALKNPESLATLDHIADAELEEYRYAIYEAYEALTDQEIPDHSSNCPAEPLGEQWDEGDLESLFPILAKKYA